MVLGLFLRLGKAKMEIRCKMQDARTKNQESSFALRSEAKEGDKKPFKCSLCL